MRKFKKTTVPAKKVNQLSEVLCCKCRAACPAPVGYSDGEDWSNAKYFTDRICISRTVGGDYRDVGGSASRKQLLYDLCPPCFTDLFAGIVPYEESIDDE